VNFLSDLDERIWADINLSALAHNAKTIKSILGGVKHMAVIKANAYGHGAVQTAAVLERCGVDYLAVACISEALELRRSGIKMPILIMGYTPVDHAHYLTEYNLAQAVFDLEYAERLSENLTKDLTIHIKVNTGMNRLGVSSAREVREIAGLKHFIPEGIFTHLADADKPGGNSVGEQLAVFNSIRDELVDIKFQITHCANSGGMLYYNESRFDMVRTGLTMYGAEGHADYKPVMRLWARVAQVSRISAGQTISYGRTYKAERDMTIAVVCAGYADGYMRSLSNKGLVEYNGILVPVVGRVCMDMLMLDVTDVKDAKAGDAVTLFGSEKLSTSRVAELAGTIHYELLCAVGDRVPRNYILT
jgi:alanine racemase